MNNLTYRLIKDRTASKAMLVLTVAFVLVAFLIGYGMYARSAPLISQNSFWELLTSDKWRPFKGEFGFYPFIMGTLWVTIISIGIALPLCLLSAIYLSEYAHKKIKRIAFPIIDLLAGIPSIIYGVWGVLIIVPFVADVIAPRFNVFTTGYSLLTGGIVLAVMLFPLMINIMSEVFNTVPQELKNASLSLGATKWQTIKHVLLRKSLPGIIAATVLSVSRAFGETIAVLMVCGNVPSVPESVFDAGYPIPALIANNFGEMLSIPLYDSALMFAALILFVIIFLFNAGSRLILARIEKNM